MNDTTTSPVSVREPGAAAFCPVCGLALPPPFFEAVSVPVHCNILWPTAEAARSAPRGSLRLSLCGGCGLVVNTAFDPRLVTYDASYESSLHHSPRFEEYADQLARDLAQHLQLRDRLVVEVGCGKGEFLKKLCRTAGARGLGIDASYDPALESEDDAGGQVTFAREPFTALPPHLAPALVVCRHVLEHLDSPAGFVAELAAAARRNAEGRVFIEVPDVLYTLRDGGIWDLIYEHCNYFSAPALARLCGRAGLRIDRIYPAFGGQFLCVESSPRSSPRASDDDLDVSELHRLAGRFSVEYEARLNHWRARLRELHASGCCVAVWGAGAKGVSFVNTVPGGDTVACMVDVNPRKHGRFVPGTGQQVVGPQRLGELRPDVIVIMNPIYRDEIERVVHSFRLRTAIELA